MKILYIMHTTKCDGSTISFINMVGGLLKEEVKPYVALPIEGEIHPILLSFLINNNIQFVRYQHLFSFLVSKENCKNNYLLLLRKWIMYAIRYMHRKNNALKTLSEFVTTINPDIIHTNSGVTNIGYFLSKRFGIPHVWHLREYQDLDFKHIFFPSKSSFIKKLNDSYVITISKDIYAHFQLSNNNKAKVIYNGICNKQEKSVSSRKENYFLCASRIDRDKAIDDAIRAFAIFHRTNRDFRLLIAGEGDPNYTKVCRELAKTLNCEDSVKFLGYRADVLALMCNATALLVPSLYEGFGRMTAEAAFSKTLVIGRNTGGTKEILNLITGYPFLTVEDFAKQMTKVANLAYKEYYQIVTDNFHKANSIFTNESNVDYVKNFYKLIIDNKL